MAAFTICGLATCSMTYRIEWDGVLCNCLFYMSVIYICKNEPDGMQVFVLAVLLVYWMDFKNVDPQAILPATATDRMHKRV